MEGYKTCEYPHHLERPKTAWWSEENHERRKEVKSDMFRSNYWVHEVPAWSWLLWSIERAILSWQLCKEVVASIGLLFDAWCPCEHVCGSGAVMQEKRWNSCNKFLFFATTVTREVVFFQQQEKKAWMTAYAYKQRRSSRRMMHRGKYFPTSTCSLSIMESIFPPSINSCKQRKRIFSNLCVFWGHCIVVCN